MSNRRRALLAGIVPLTALLAAGCADLGIGPVGQGAEVARLRQELAAAQAENARLSQQLYQSKDRNQLRAQELALRVQELRHTEQALLRMANELGGMPPQPWTPTTPGGSPSPTWPTTGQSLTGKVTRVDTAAGQVVIDRGQVHGVKKGDSLVVERAGQRIGKIIVDVVYADASSARLVQGEMKAAIGVGDDVRTMRPGD